MIRRLVACLAGASALASAMTVSGHSLLLEASPAAGTTVKTPARVVLRFNSRIEHRLSRVRVVDAAGATRDLSLATDAPPDRLVADAAAMAPGAWTVEWQVLSTDGHVVSGRFEFRLAPTD